MVDRRIKFWSDNNSTGGHESGMNAAATCGLHSCPHCLGPFLTLELL